MLKPSVVAFSSGTTTFPVDRPLGALYCNENSGRCIQNLQYLRVKCVYFSGGRIVAIGAGHMFSDKYIDQENNEKFREILFEFLKSSGGVKVTHTDHDDVDVSFV